jgi:hypothetical protein
VSGPRLEEYCLKCGSANIVDDYDREGGRAELVKKCLCCSGRRIGQRPRVPLIVAAPALIESKPEVTAPEKTDISGPAKGEKRIVSGERKSLTKLVAGSPFGKIVSTDKTGTPTQEECMSKSIHPKCTRCISKNPKSTKYVVLQDRCSGCFKEEHGISVAEFRRQKLLADRDKPPIKADKGEQAAAVRARFRQVRLALGTARRRELGTHELSIQIGKNKGWVWRIENKFIDNADRRSRKVIDAFCKGTGAREEWIKTDEGAMWQEGKAPAGEPLELAQKRTIDYSGKLCNRLEPGEIKFVKDPMLLKSDGIHLDFTLHEDLKEFLLKSAQEDFRTPAQEILWMLSTLKKAGIAAVPSLET